MMMMTMMMMMMMMLMLYHGDDYDDDDDNDDGDDDDDDDDDDGSRWLAGRPVVPSRDLGRSRSYCMRSYSRALRRRGKGLGSTPEGRSIGGRPVVPLRDLGRSRSNCMRSYCRVGPFGPWGPMAQRRRGKGLGSTPEGRSPGGRPVVPLRDLGSFPKSLRAVLL